jgi:hypothetical protein
VTRAASRLVGTLRAFVRALAVLLVTTMPAVPQAPSSLLSDPRDALMALWPGEYDLTEETVLAPEDRDARIGAATSTRIQYAVRPVQLPWLGTHVLYAEEYLYDDPANVRRQVLLSLERTSPEEGDVRVRQFTRKVQPRPTEETLPLARDELETLAGCDLWLIQEGEQFRGGTRGTSCSVAGGTAARFIDYQLVVAEGLFWSRRRTVDAETEDLLEEVALFRYFELEEARLFTCSARWSRDGTRRAQREIATFDVHDQGGRARFTTPDQRVLEFELHGRDWPANSPRQSLVLILNAVPQLPEPLALSWTTLDAGQIAVDLGWIAVECGPVVRETGEKDS